MVVPARHSPRPSGAPRPDHRRHIMDQRQGLAVAAQPLRDAPAEPRAVDRHHRVGPLRADRRYRFAHPAQDRRRPRQHLGDPDHRELVERHQAGEALLAHALAADPGDPQTAAGALPQCRDQPGAQRVARRLAGDNEDERRGSAHAGHLRPSGCRRQRARRDRRHRRPRRGRAQSSPRPRRRCRAARPRRRASRFAARSSAGRRAAPDPASRP